MCPCIVVLHYIHIHNGSVYRCYIQFLVNQINGGYNKLYRYWGLQNEKKPYVQLYPRIVVLCYIQWFCVQILPIVPSWSNKWWLIEQMYHRFEVNSVCYFLFIGNKFHKWKWSISVDLPSKSWYVHQYQYWSLLNIKKKLNVSYKLFNLCKSRLLDQMMARGSCLSLCVVRNSGIMGEIPCEQVMTWHSHIRR